MASAPSLGPAPDSSSRPINFAIWTTAIRFRRCIDAVRQAVGSEVNLMIDFDQGLHLGEALERCHAMVIQNVLNSSVTRSAN